MMELTQTVAAIALSAGTAGADYSLTILSKTIFTHVLSQSANTTESAVLKTTQRTNALAVQPFVAVI
jgi:hypothetical protein